MVWPPASRLIIWEKLIDAMEAYMKNPELTVEQLLTIMPGPDFPTGGIVVNKDELPADLPRPVQERSRSADVLKWKN